MKIKLKLSPDAILAVDWIFDNFCKGSLPGRTQEQKVLLSISYDLDDTFQKQANKVVRSSDLFNTKKKMGIGLKYYQAWALEKIIREMLPLVDNLYKKTLLGSLADDINQKLQ